MDQWTNLSAILEVFPTILLIYSLELEICYIEGVKSLQIIIIRRMRMSEESQPDSPIMCLKNSPKRQKQQRNDQQMQILEQNKNLRRKLKQLSSRLDQQLQKAAKAKLKQKPNQNIDYLHAGSPEGQSLELQNAYKMIERLQRTVKDFESKQAYQISFKRILDLESIIKKKQGENQELKLQVKDMKKQLRDKDKHVNDLLDKQAVNPNLNEQKQQIQKLKTMLKKFQVENQQLKKKEFEKHKKLVTAQRKIVEMEQAAEQPIGKHQELLEKIEQLQKKYKQSILRIDKQNSYISKLNSKISTMIEQSPMKRRRGSLNTSQEQKVSRSMDQLPDIPSNKVKPIILDHIPSSILPASVPSKVLRRY